jgi:hypothetical protein
MTISRAFPRAGTAMAALFLTAALFQAVPARADVVFDFSATCKTNGAGTATGVLTLADSAAASILPAPMIRGLSTV